MDDCLSGAGGKLKAKIYILQIKIRSRVAPDFSCELIAKRLYLILKRSKFTTSYHIELNQNLQKI
jgi:hypothetical protein